MNLFEIDSSRAERLGNLAAEVGYNPFSFEDANLFPSAQDSYITINYFFFLTAIDHKTHPPDKIYAAVIEGKLDRGSDLLYWMARQIQLKQPHFLQFLSGSNQVTDSYREPNLPETWYY